MRQVCTEHKSSLQLSGTLGSILAASVHHIAVAVAGAVDSPGPALAATVVSDVVADSRSPHQLPRLIPVMSDSGKWKKDNHQAVN